MCTVTVKVNEKALRGYRPELSSVAAISNWVQELVDLHLQQMAFEEDEVVDLETARALTHAAIREEYAKV